ncbi:hypothetical protein NDU88_010061 [Pleurodeles waltl]|uniref:Uncharacterized protein n=1 Tax=Pleurodeles waltl TaxID=8319 RepID=A0AAV7RY23_PLEWA|nr:hypothetical protein NDU88_010061 [Pleurodeles waltl]
MNTSGTTLVLFLRQHPLCTITGLHVGGELQTLGTVKQNISSLKDIHKESIVYVPRVVGGSSPEKGNHFILWVLNGKTNIIQVFDSLGIYNSIEDYDMNILCNIFNSESCGVFVCTVEKFASVPQETELHTEQLTPKGDTVGAAERVFEKSKTRKSLVQRIDGTGCMATKVMVCLYQESDDLKKKLRNSLKISGIENLLTEDEMKEYSNNVIKGKKKSHRMFLFSNPTFIRKLKQDLKMRMTIFNENDARRLMEQIKQVPRFSLCCRNTPLMIDVLLPEITIKLLQKIEGLNRYEAELVLMRGYLRPSDEDELVEVQTMKKVKRDALK